MKKRHISEFLKTSFGGGRAAGHGMAYESYDYYGDEDWPDRDHTQDPIWPVFPSDLLPTDAKYKLGGPVKRYNLKEVMPKHEAQSNDEGLSRSEK